MVFLRVFLLLIAAGVTTAFVAAPMTGVVPRTQPRRAIVVRAEKKEDSSNDGPFAFLKQVKKGIDDIVDDAMMKKLGNGQYFYGKRKSNFYGADDPGKRRGPEDAKEYAGPKGGSYFKLDRDGRPVTRRGTPIRTPPSGQRE